MTAHREVLVCAHCVFLPGEVVVDPVAAVQAEQGQPSHHGVVGVEAAAECTFESLVEDCGLLLGTCAGGLCEGGAVPPQPGDVVVTGTPSGVGFARKPPLWMKPGDIVEIEIEGLGKLINTVQDEVR